MRPLAASSPATSSAADGSPEKAMAIHPRAATHRMLRMRNAPGRAPARRCHGPGAQAEAEQREYIRRLSPQTLAVSLRHASAPSRTVRSEEHTSELQSLAYLVCRLLLEKKKIQNQRTKNNI